jgi:hypothetical protein
MRLSNPLLGNSSVNRLLRRPNDVTATVLSRDLFSVLSVWRLYNEYLFKVKSETFVEVGLNTSTVILRVVGVDKKRSLKSETVKYGHESQGTLTQERLHWQGPAAYTKDRPALSSDRAPDRNKTVTVKQ